MQMVVITAQLLELTEPAQTFPEVKAPAAPAPLPAAVTQALPEVKFSTAPEQLPAEVAQALPEPPLQAVPSPRERPTPELAESAASPSSASSRFRLHYHLAAKDGLVVRHGESTLTFDGDTDQYVADFAWGGAHGFQIYSLEKMFETVTKVFERRGMMFNETERAILTDIFNNTEQHRRF